MALCLVRAGVVLAFVCAACGESVKEYETGGAGAGGHAGAGARAGQGGSGGTGDATGGRAGSSGGKAGSSATAGGPASAGAADDAGAPGEARAGTSGTTGGTTGAGTGGTGATGGVPLANGPVEIARVVCDRIFNCCSDAELAALPQNLGDSEGTCQLAVAVYLTLIVQGSQASLDAGRIRYDGVELSECLAEYAGADCSLLRTLDLSICPGIFAPQVELGDACGINGDCIDGYCEGSNDASNPVGECAAKKPLGEACEAGGECASTLCDPVGDGCVEAADSPLCGA